MRVRETLQLKRAGRPGWKAGAVGNSAEYAWEVRVAGEVGERMSEGAVLRAPGTPVRRAVASADLAGNDHEAGATMGWGRGRAASTRPAPNKALLLARKSYHGKACPRQGAAASLADRWPRAAERHPLVARVESADDAR